jgi:hypothetical protein
LEEGSLSWTNWTEGELSFWVFEEDRLIVPPWVEESDVEDYRQAALEGIEEYMGIVDEMPEPLQAEMRRYLEQFRDQLWHSEP